MRTILASTVAVVAATACTAVPESAPTDDAPVYLALGDSVAFGYDPLVPNREQVTGYPEELADRIGLPVVNASCPGEASGGFIDPGGNDNNCRENRQAYPLHVRYEGTQLGFALEFLATHPNTQLVTIDIGGNDAGKLDKTCAGDTGCVLGGFIGMLTEYEHNVNVIFDELREVYDGPIVALAIYNPYPADAIASYGLERLNSVLAGRATRHGVIYADGMRAFTTAAADPCSAGLLIRMPDGTCDIHTSPAGDDILASAIETALASY